MIKTPEIKQRPLRTYLEEQRQQVEKRALNLLDPEIGHIDLAELALTVGRPRRRITRDHFSDYPEIRAQRGIALLHGMLEHPEITKVLYEKKTKKRKIHSPLDGFGQRSARTERALRLIDLTVKEVTSNPRLKRSLELQEDLFVAAVALGQVLAVDRLVEVRDDRGRFVRRVPQEKTVRRLVLHHGLQRLGTENEIVKQLADKKKHSSKKKHK